MDLLSVYQKGVKGQYRLRVAPASMKRLKLKLKGLKRPAPFPWTERIRQINRLIKVGCTTSSMPKPSETQRVGRLATQPTALLYLETLEESRKAKAQLYSIGGSPRSGICMVALPDGRMDHCVQSHYEDYHNRQAPQAKRLSSVGGVLSFDQSCLTNRPVRGPYAGWCERCTGATTVASAAYSIGSWLFF